MGEGVREKGAASGSVGLAGARWGVEDIVAQMADVKISTVPKVERNEGIVPQSTNSSKREKTTWRYMARPARPAFSRWRPRVRNVCAANPNIPMVMMNKSSRREETHTIWPDLNRSHRPQVMVHEYEK